MLDKFIAILSDRASSTGDYRRQRAYRSVLKRIRLYIGEEPLRLSTVFMSDFLAGFRKSLLADELCPNTICFYMNMARSIYKAAISEKRIKAVPDLLRFFPTKTVPTKKRAASLETIATLHAANLSAKLKMEQCRDLFMLSFYLQGISFIDLLNLRKSDLNGNRLSYTRQKTGKVVSVCLTDEALEYLSRLLACRENGSSFLLPLLTLKGKDGHRQYQTILRRYNRWLKKLGELLGIRETLTSYVARHSWATMAYHSGVKISIVSQAMGHSAEKTTRIYLSSFEDKHIREANLTVSDAVLRQIRAGDMTNVREEVRKQCASCNGTKSGKNRKTTARTATTSSPERTYAGQERQEYTNRAEQRRMKKEEQKKEEMRKEEERRRMKKEEQKKEQIKKEKERQQMKEKEQKMKKKEQKMKKKEQKMKKEKWKWIKQRMSVS
jgi:site-specific recombinase XerD